MTYETTEIRTLGSREPIAIHRRCLHDERVIDVESGGEVVARLCLDCDAQLPVYRPAWEVQ